MNAGVKLGNSTGRGAGKRRLERTACRGYLKYKHPKAEKDPRAVFRVQKGLGTKVSHRAPGVNYIGRVDYTTSGRDIVTASERGEMSIALHQSLLGYMYLAKIWI